MTDDQILSAALRSAWADTYAPLRDCVAEITKADYGAASRVMSLARERGFVRERGMVDWQMVEAYNDQTRVKA